MSAYKKIFEYLRLIFKKCGRKKLIENSIIVIIIGMIAIISGGYFKNDPKVAGPMGKKGAVSETSEVASTKQVQSSDPTEDLQKRMEFILSKVQGAGSVNVMITFVSGKEIVPAFDSKSTNNDTQEKDSGGGSRSTKNIQEENKLVFEEKQGGSSSLVVLKELTPKVQGAVIAADGASDPVVRENIFRAAQVLLDVPVHKIQVLPKK